MATPAASVQTVHLDILTNYVVSMARTVELAVDRALSALLQAGSPESRQAPGEIFLLEPRVNEMEMVIDEHAVRMLRGGLLSSEEIRQVVATLKITNDLERMGDLAVNLAERIISLAEMHPIAAPPELEPMVGAVRAMIKKGLGALIFENVVLASEVLESDDLVDRYRNEIFERLLAGMRRCPGEVAASLQLVLLPLSGAPGRSRRRHCRRHYFLGSRTRRAARAGRELRRCWYSCYREFIAA